MSRKRSDEPESETAEESTPAPATPPPPPPAPVPMLSFDRWFALTGRPAHHRLGLLAFIGARARGKKPKSAWDELFKNY